jgi:glycosyltransferase involved in cell wall biosynthesis
MPDGSPWPRISIVTPSYNQGQFLEETIRSVLLQGYPNLEYIIVDGGSTDGSVDIIRKYEPWLAHWESEKDRGQSHAINKGFQRATGKIVAWLNSDDFYYPSALSHAAEQFRQNPAAGLVYGNCDLVDEGGAFLRVKGGSWDYERLLGQVYFGQPATFINPLGLSDAGDLDESLHIPLDWDLWLRIGMSAPGVFMDGAPLAAARMWDGCKTVEAQAHDSAKIYAEHEIILRKLGQMEAFPVEWRETLRREHCKVYRRLLSLYLRRENHAAARALLRRIRAEDRECFHSIPLGKRLRAAWKVRLPSRP